MNLTALIACKDRPRNIAFCLASINSCEPRPRTVVVDFGSERPLSFPQYSEWLKIIRVDRRTNFFHKARALNIGIRRIKAKFLCITDADQIFHPNFFGVVYRTLVKNPRKLVMCGTHFLENLPSVDLDAFPDIYYKLLKLAKKKGLKIRGDGCCNGLLLSEAKSIHGYDEAYIGYSAEDSDFALRVKLHGLERLWITKKTSMVHLPHPKSGKYYSATVRKENRVRFFRRKKKRDVIVNKNGNWGKV